MNMAKVDKIIKKWKRDPEYVIEMLQDVQDEYRHLPEAVLRYMADDLDVPLARLYHIGTFFSSFSLEEKGKHVVQICMGTACHVKGAQRVLEAFNRELGLDAEKGGTTADRSFTVEPVRCLGCCSLAPVISVDGDLMGPVRPEQVPDIIRKTAKPGKGAN